MSTKTAPPFAILDTAINALNDVLPHKPWADRAIHWLRFCLHHRRRPGPHMRYNDVLYRQVVSPAGQAPLIVKASCKAQTKDHLAPLVGAEHVVPTLALLKTPAEIDAYEFPDVCVIKGTAASGQAIIKEPDDSVDRTTLKRWLKATHYHFTREVNYKPLRNMVIVEPLVTDAGLADNVQLVCYRGRVGLAFFNEFSAQKPTRAILDRDWRPLNCSKGLPLRAVAPPRPMDFEGMRAAAEKVAGAFVSLRVDFFVAGDKWWIGELSHIDGAALSSFIPLEAEHLANRLLFGEEAFEGPYETHGGFGSKRVPASWAEMGLDPPEAATELGLAGTFVGR